MCSANPGYCSKCSCDKFDRQYLHEGSDWWCTCGHRWDDHLFSDRPSRNNNVSFSGTVDKVSQTVDHTKESIFPYICIGAIIILIIGAVKNN